VVERKSEKISWKKNPDGKERAKVSKERRPGSTERKNRQNRSQRKKGKHQNYLPRPGRIRTKPGVEGPEGRVGGKPEC